MDKINKNLSPEEKQQLEALLVKAKSEHQEEVHIESESHAQSVPEPQTARVENETIASDNVVEFKPTTKALVSTRDDQKSHSEIKNLLTDVLQGNKNFDDLKLDITTTKQANELIDAVNEMEDAA